MALGAVLLALVGALALWLVVDAGRERHRLRARLGRSLPAAEHRPPDVAGAVPPLVPPPGGVTG